MSEIEITTAEALRDAVDRGAIIRTVPLANDRFGAALPTTTGRALAHTPERGALLLHGARRAGTTESEPIQDWWEVDLSAVRLYEITD